MINYYGLDGITLDNTMLLVTHGEHKARKSVIDEITKRWYKKHRDSDPRDRMTRSDFMKKRRDDVIKLIEVNSI